MRWGGGGEGALMSGEVYNRQFTVQPASKFSGALWRWGGKRKESLQLRLWNLKTAISRKVIGKMCTRQSRKVIWDMFNTLFLTL